MFYWTRSGFGGHRAYASDDESWALAQRRAIFFAACIGFVAWFTH
jgi:hypothetical protein